MPLKAVKPKKPKRQKVKFTKKISNTIESIKTRIFCFCWTVRMCLVAIAVLTFQLFLFMLKRLVGTLALGVQALGLCFIAWEILLKAIENRYMPQIVERLMIANSPDIPRHSKFVMTVENMNDYSLTVAAYERMLTILEEMKFQIFVSLIFMIFVWEFYRFALPFLHSVVRPIDEKNQ